MELKFEHAALEQEIERLAAEVKQRASAETSEARKEATKQVIGEEIYSKSAPQSLVSSPQPSPALPGYLQNASDEVKLLVEKLVDLAWHKGIAFAVKESRKSGAFYVDALHDALTDKLYEEFRNRGLL